MKKLMALLLAAMLSAALSFPALADVIWEPYGDFWSEHSNECEYLDGARFEAQTDTPLVASPDDPAVLDTIPAGDVVYVGYSWQGGELWGAVEGFRREGSDTWQEGWVRLADFRKLYGPAEFAADHQNEFFEADGGVTVTNRTPVVLWTFPGSGETAGTVGGPDFWMEEETASFDRVWTDEDGHDWAQLSYFYGLRGCWVYLPDPETDSLPRTAPRYADGSPAAPGTPEAPEQPAPAETPTPEPMPERPVQPIVPILVPAVLVIAAAAAAAVLIVVLTKKKRR